MATSMPWRCSRPAVRRRQAAWQVLGRSPYDADTLIAAATWANQRGDVAATLRYLTTLRLVRPDDRAIGAEIERLRRAPTGR